MTVTGSSRPDLSAGQLDPRRHLRPWFGVVALTLCGALVLGLCAAASPRLSTGQAFFPLYSGTVAVGSGGAVVPVFDPGQLVPDTRVLANTPHSAEQSRAQLAWLASGTIPSVPELGDSTLVRDALLDLHVLGSSHGVAVAGWGTPWRYVWPRDSALVAAALVRTGHLQDAERVVGFLERVQPADGTFQARYRPDGTGVPDGRGSQSDSLGWALWALRQVADAWPATSRRAFLERHRQLLDRSTEASLRLLDNPRSLPPASSDYWEMKEKRLTLSTATLLHAGLVASAALYAELGDRDRSDDAGDAAARTAAAVHRRFAPNGYPRYAGGPAWSVDLGVSYLLPPFTDRVDPQVLEVWRASAGYLARPAGGLAPGGSWRQDGVSWNTATSSYAMTAAVVGDRDAAVERLRWLADHRTAAGSLPEKVLADGRPASVAPLAWAAAAVIIAADELNPAPR